MENPPTCVDDILNIPDFQTANKLLRYWNISSKGISNKEGAIRLLLQKWSSKENEQGNVDLKSTKGLQEAILLDEQNRKELFKRYNECLDFYSQLPAQHQADLDRVFQNLMHMVEKRKQKLKARNCTILVAGETGAGKSSFINLLLGTSILPTASLPCTATVCELRTCLDSNKSAILTYRLTDDGTRMQQKTLDLHTATGLRELAECIAETDPYYGESPYDKIEINWPFPILQEGIVIVDTPGIGGGKQMSMIVEQYLSKSFGFIYLVNSSSAGGIQKGRLKDFLRTVVNYAEDDFSSSATMFVCNKWETVPDSDKAEVKSNTFDKLVRIYPGLGEDQIYYMSVQQALLAAEYKLMTKGHAAVSEGVENLFHSSLRNNLNIHYRWLCQVFKRANYSLKVATIMGAKSLTTNQETISDLYRRMERLVVNSTQSVEDLHKGVAFEVGSLYKNITTLLRDRDFVQNVVIWEAKDCPRPDDWKKTAHEASERIASRIALELNIWERNNSIISGIKEKIVKKFKRDFELMEDRIKAIEGVLVDGNTRIISDLHKSMKKQLPLKRLFKKARSNADEDSVKGLGGTVCSFAGFDVKEKNVKKIFSGYKKENRQEKMIEATEMFISNILSGHNLQVKLDKYLGKFVRGIDSVAKMIPEFIKADKQLIQTLEKQMENTKGNLKGIYPDLIGHCRIIQSKLDLFFVYRILKLDIRLSDLEWNESDKLGDGAFAIVYKAKLRKGNDVIPVAVKVCRDTVKESTVTDILLEDRAMRELEHENIVKFYGSTCRQDKEGRVTWILVTELCDGTLKDLVIDNKGSFQNPGKCEVCVTQKTRMKEMAQYVLQICRGIECLHSKELVHRDLKCENILVSKGVLKLSDFGVTKAETDITGSYKGSPIYMAPEILLQAGLYDRRADIYSLAIVLWEMWYGNDAAEEMKMKLCFLGDHQAAIKHLQTAIKNGFRLRLTIKVKPPEDWSRLIERCWEFEPQNRPELVEIINFFEDFLQRN